MQYPSPGLQRCRSMPLVSPNVNTGAMCSLSTGEKMAVVRHHLPSGSAAPPTAGMFTFVADLL